MSVTNDSPNRAVRPGSDLLEMGILLRNLPHGAVDFLTAEARPSLHDDEEKPKIGATTSPFTRTPDTCQEERESQNIGQVRGSAQQRHIRWCRSWNKTGKGGFSIVFCDPVLQILLSIRHQVNTGFVYGLINPCNSNPETDSFCFMTKYFIRFVLFNETTKFIDKQSGFCFLKKKNIKVITGNIFFSQVSCCAETAIQYKH